MIFYPILAIFVTSVLTSKSGDNSNGRLTRYCIRGPKISCWCLQNDGTYVAWGDWRLNCDRLPRTHKFCSPKPAGFSTCHCIREDGLSVATGDASIDCSWYNYGEKKMSIGPRPRPRRNF